MGSGPFTRGPEPHRAFNHEAIQVTGCIDPSKSPLRSSDEGGQFDVRFPNGAQCTFGGYNASFIEQCVDLTLHHRACLTHRILHVIRGQPRFYDVDGDFPSHLSALAVMSGLSLRTRASVSVVAPRRAIKSTAILTTTAKDAL